MNQLIQSFLDETALLKSKHTFRTYQYGLSRFDRFLTENQLLEFNRETAVRFIGGLKGKIGPASVSQMETSVRAFYSWLVAQSHLQVNPLLGQRIAGYHSPRRGDNFSMDGREYGRLKAQARENRWSKWWEGMIIVAWNTGMRLGDCAQLKWSEINFDRKLIAVIPQKTVRFNRRLEIPILPELKNYLDGVAREEGAIYVFPIAAATYQNAPRYLTNQFRALCVRAKVKGKSFHSIRHSFVTRALSRGMSVAMLSEITGQNMEVIQRYLHPTLEDKTKSMQCMVEEK